MNLKELSTHELMLLQSKLLEILRERGVVRTANNPVGDYTEWLVAQAMGLKLTHNSQSGHDAESRDGTRIQIKGRRVTKLNPSLQLSAIRKLDRQQFDLLIAVVFNEQFEIHEALAIPHEIIAEYAVYRQHTNAHILIINQALREDSRVREISQQLRLVSICATHRSGESLAMA